MRIIWTFFKDINDTPHSFRRFAGLLPSNGVLIINGEIPALDEITDNLDCPVITFGLTKECDYFADNISFDEHGYGHFDMICNGTKEAHIALHVIGRHNIANALSAIALAQYYHIDMDSIRKGLLAFEGTERRFRAEGIFQRSDCRGRLCTPSDRDHSDTDCCREVSTQASVVRIPATHLLKNPCPVKGVCTGTVPAENVVLADIYAAREADPGDISSRTLQEELKKLGKDAYYFPSFEEIEKFLSEKCINGDLLITMGAGNV